MSTQVRIPLQEAPAGNIGIFLLCLLCSMLMNGLVLFSAPWLSRDLEDLERPPEQGIAIEVAPDEPPPVEEPPAPAEPEPVVEPDPAPEETAAEPEPEPEPAPVEKKEEPKPKPRPKPKPKPRPVTPRPDARPSPVPAPAAATSAVSDAPRPSPPRPLAEYANRPPEYPPLARKRNQQGKVVVRAHIDVTGSVVRVEVFKSSGFSALDEGAMKAIRKWKFEPSRSGGTPVPGTVMVPVDYRLK